LDFDLRHLHCVFEFACEKELIDKNPVVAPPQRCDYHISRPFTADEVAQWEDCAGRDHVQDSSYNEWLPFWLLRWTGFRDRDAVDLCWREVFLDDKRIAHKCHKNHKEVTLPILEEESLLRVLLAEHNRRHPLPDERVLVDPGGNMLTVLKLYKVIRELGKRAGVLDVNPYRFRGTYAVEMLLRSNNVYYVANLLGDTIAVVERHYMPYVRELREHTRIMLENGVGLRQFVLRKSQ
jgi:integrase